MVKAAGMSVMVVHMVQAPAMEMETIMEVEANQAQAEVTTETDHCNPSTGHIISGPL